MRRTATGFTSAEVGQVYKYLGFDSRDGSSHTIYIHPEFPELRATVKRGSSLPASLRPRPRKIGRPAEETEGIMIDDSMQGYMNLRYDTHILPERDGEGHLVYVAVHPELPGCVSHGDSPREAVESLREARELYISTLLERGLEVPPPRSRTASSDAELVVWEVLETVDSGDVQEQSRLGVSLASS